MRGCSESRAITSRLRSLLVVENDRDVDGVRDRGEIALDLRVLEQKIGFEHGENAIGA
jgi:hypothetical protein